MERKTRLSICVVGVRNDSSSLRVAADEIKGSADFGLMAKSRLFRVQEAIFGQMGKVV